MNRISEIYKTGIIHTWQASQVFLFFLQTLFSPQTSFPSHNPQIKKSNKTYVVTSLLGVKQTSVGLFFFPPFKEREIRQLISINCMGNFMTHHEEILLHLDLKRNKK